MDTPFLLPRKLLLISDFRNIFRNVPADRQLAAGGAEFTIDTFQLGLHILTLAPLTVQFPAIVNQQVNLALQGIAQHGKLAVRVNLILQEKTEMFFIPMKFHHLLPDDRGRWGAPGLAVAVEDI